MTKGQKQVFHILMALSAAFEERRKQLRQAKATAEQAILEALIAVFVQDAFEQVARTRDLERLQQEKTTLTAELNTGNPSLLGTATQLKLLAALKAVERQRHVHHLRRVAATAALALNEQAARAFVRVVTRPVAAKKRGAQQLASA